jgi:hypothetical protein
MTDKTYIHWRTIADHPDTVSEYVNAAWPPGTETEIEVVPPGHYLLRWSDGTVEGWDIDEPIRVEDWPCDDRRINRPTHWAEFNQPDDVK